jgi:two-component system, chemotaxis family, chemotaxis protein CheY
MMMAYNVLIVDDSATMRALVRKVLKITGLDLGECFEGANGREALQILEKNWIDLILSDLHMPEMDGAALVKTLRQNSLWQSIPFVLITTEGRQEVLDSFFQNGIQGYIKKPFRPEDIKEKLQTILGEAWVPHAGELEGCDF